MVTLTLYKNTDFNALVKLLELSNLPTSDLKEDLPHFVVIKDENKEIIAVGGVEQYGNVGLLRSIAVHPDCRNEGWGNLLIKKLEKSAQIDGVEQLYLLTTTAAPYFSKMQYQIIERNNVPNEIKESTEFSALCPSSATVMRKKLL